MDIAEDGSVLGRPKVPPLKGGQKRYRTETRTKDLKYPGKAAVIAIQCSDPDRAAILDFYNHPQRL